MAALRVSAGSYPGRNPLFLMGLSDHAFAPSRQACVSLAIQSLDPDDRTTAHGGSAADAFHVICPSLPGFGFSAKPATRGWGVDRIASAWAVLMNHLGYDSYGAQGGDWGSAVTTALGAQDPTHCAGIHITLAMGARPNTAGQPTPEEARALQGRKYYADWDSGYSKQQSTRPQTLGYGLTDSP